MCLGLKQVPFVVPDTMLLLGIAMLPDCLQKRLTWLQAHGMARAHGIPTKQSAKFIQTKLRFKHFSALEVCKFKFVAFYMFIYFKHKAENNQTKFHNNLNVVKTLG